MACVDIYPTPPTNPSDMPKIELLCTFVTSTPSPLMWFVADVPSVSKTRKACECIKSSIVATPWTRQVHLLWLTLLNDEEPRKTNRREKNKQLQNKVLIFHKIFVYIRTKKTFAFLYGLGRKRPAFFLQTNKSINDEFEIKLIYTI